VFENERFSSDIESGAQPIHTPGGMAEPASSTGPSADGADIASTDTNQTPSSHRPEEPNATYAPEPASSRGPTREGGTSGVPAELEPEAIRRLEGEISDLRDRQLRLAAEFDNYRKRVARERVELSDRAQAAFVLRLLDVLDDMDRIVAEQGSAPAESLRQAMEMIDRKLWKELEAAGVERIDPAGAAFNPSEHEAVSTLPARDGGKDQTVSATFQPGYRFKGQLVRPARVQVYSTQGAG
jgi:molecular chaperone GrpE